MLNRCSYRTRALRETAMFYHFVDKNVELQRDLPEIPWLVGVRVGAGEEETSVDPGARLQLSCSCQG